MNTEPLIDTESDNQLAKGKHGVFIYNRHDIFIGRALEFYGEYSEHEVELFRQLLRPGDTVIEVGANIGAHTVPMCRFVGSTGRVIGFEPQNQVFQILNGNLAINSLSNATVFRLGVGAENTTTRITEFDYSQQGNFGNASFDTNAGELISVIRLDDFSDWDSLRLLKVDVEGMELAVLQGAENLIRTQKPIIFVENDREDKAQALTDYLYQLGYQLVWFRTLMFNPQNFNGMSENIFENYYSQNLLCLLPEHGIDVSGFELYQGWQDLSGNL